LTRRKRISGADIMDTSEDLTPFVRGERIYLREVLQSDVNENYHRWMNDPEVTRYLETRFYPNTKEILKKYVQAKVADRDNVFLAIVLKENHRHIGNIKLGPINWVHRSADIGIIIGEKDCWGEGYACEAISLIVDYAFKKLNLNKLGAGCYNSNKASLQIFQKNGFEIEGVRKQHVFCDGKYEDYILLGLTNPTTCSHE